MHHNGKQHALFRQARVTEQHLAQFQMTATADRKEFRQPLNDPKNNCFKITHLISLIAVGWLALFFLNALVKTISWTSGAIGAGIIAACTVNRGASAQQQASRRYG